MERDIERYCCSVCKVDIKKAKCFTVFDDNNVICSDCCKFAVLFHFGYINNDEFKLLPNYTRKYCLNFHIRELEKENNDLLDGKTIEKWLMESKKDIKLIDEVVK